MARAPAQPMEAASVHVSFRNPNLLAGEPLLNPVSAVLELGFQEQLAPECLPGGLVQARRQQLEPRQELQGPQQGQQQLRRWLRAGPGEREPDGTSGSP